jgi:hypothetical protein
VLRADGWRKVRLPNHKDSRSLLLLHSLLAVIQLPSSLRPQPPPGPSWQSPDGYPEMGTTPSAEGGRGSAGFHLIRPARAAFNVACVRSEAPSLAMML